MTTFWHPLFKHKCAFVPHKQKTYLVLFFYLKEQFYIEVNLKVIHRWKQLQ